METSYRLEDTDNVSLNPALITDSLVVNEESSTVTMVSDTHCDARQSDIRLMKNGIVNSIADKMIMLNRRSVIKT